MHSQHGGAGCCRVGYKQMGYWLLCLPALQISTWHGLPVCLNASANCFTDANDDRSHAITVSLALACFDLMSAAAASPNCVLRTAMMTSAPCDAMALAASLPRPVLQPVIITTCVATPCCQRCSGWDRQHRDAIAAEGAGQFAFSETCSSRQAAAVHGQMLLLVLAGWNRMHRKAPWSAYGVVLIITQCEEAHAAVSSARKQLSCRVYNA